MPPVFCIISLGRAKGKTALIEWLIERLTSSGIRVATIKHSTKSFDTEGKDTWRHLESGAVEVVYVSENELVTLRREKASLNEAINALHVSPDIILVEGFKDSPYPKILCSNDPHEVAEAMDSVQNIIAVTGELASDAAPGLEVKLMDVNGVYRLLRQAVLDYWIRLIPGLDCGKCRYGSCKGLEENIRGGRATIRECVIRDSLVSKVTIDGAEVPLGIWPQKLLRELLLAFIKSLKLDGVRLEEANRIVVNINLRAASD